ncbi:hypothetical protein RIU76_08525 [Latilactobacillus sakei subsp. sakei]|uniref:hypothetical protein n=1 Tax=Latilactobacillus TaxID=2767885 RepID=UPI0005009A2F|nr:MULTISPECIES: hypothetical protein [Latilactobacillus]KGB14239.1 hypothetical protein KY41_08425 [Latilactobacillus sakei]MCS8582386.1 hypothetical protein [Latilactobacillus curvatus]MCS8607004.1 hypothetical protein [Latilactobacillus curvatus]MCS8617096.1 hypothetical protein [Latilactobacillus curvatus]MDR7924738.1 hypothetical protein [Latilactobacillus sakei subsp. sakei]
MLLKEFGKSIGNALRAVAKGVTNEIERRPEYKKDEGLQSGLAGYLKYLARHQAYLNRHKGETTCRRWHKANKKWR